MCTLFHSHKVRIWLKGLLIWENNIWLDSRHWISISLDRIELIWMALMGSIMKMQDRKRMKLQQNNNKNKNKHKKKQIKHKKIKK